MKIIINIFCVVLFIYGNELQLISTIGNFDSASKFYISNSGYIYVIDSKLNKVYQLDTLGNYYNETGGFGWCNTCFDTPTDIFATSLNIFVIDKNNNTLTIFDKNLNYINKVDLSKLPYGYNLSQPKLLQISVDGFIYIYDENKLRIIKYTMNLKYVNDFGGMNYADFYVSKINKLVVDDYVYAVSDSVIFIFDKYGANLRKINFQKNIKNFFAKYGQIFTIFDGYIEYTNTLQNRSFTFNCELTNINDIFYLNGKLYLLLQDKIMVFKII
jgi:hypothetical protein